MINLKNIIKVLLVALFICAYSGEGLAQCNPPCKEGEICIKTISNVAANFDGSQSDTYQCRSKAKENNDPAKIAGDSGNQTTQDPTFCGSDYGIFNELVQTGQKIFKRLRDLIYVVAGFGIIAVAVGGFFGNLNWKWLGAIVISLVVVATAGELVVLMTGCEQFGASLVTNTLTTPTTSMSTEQYNEMYTEKTESAGKIAWDDYFDEGYGYGQSSSITEQQNGVTFEEGVQSE